jgi:hypothetical protein
MSFEDKKFGLLTILRAVDENDRWIAYSRYADRYWCLCRCGNELVVWRSMLANGVMRNCGMCRRKGRGGRFRRWGTVGHHIRHTITRGGKHRTYATGEWHSWSTMIARCTRKTHHAWDNYGGRGIRVCKRWREANGQGFLNFLSDLGPRPWGKTLDRVNPQGHYEPTNTRWADAKDQTNNQRRFRWRGTTPPPVEKVRVMEARVEEYATGFEVETACAF